MTILIWILGASVAFYFYYNWRVETLMAEATAGDPGGVGANSSAAPDSEYEDHDYLDMDALRRPRSDLPVVEIDGGEDLTYKGGAAGPTMNVYCSGSVDTEAEPYAWQDRRQGPRRTATGRRASDAEPKKRKSTHEGDEQRLSQRRVWLRREEDEAQYELVDVNEAAKILATNPDEIEKWIRTADLPFFMVTRGVNRELRFDRHELLGWLGVEDVVEARSREGER